MNFINARFYKPFSLIRSVSLIKNLYNVTEAAGMNTKQQQQHYSKYMRLQLMQNYWADFNGLNTKWKLRSEHSELKTKEKYMQLCDINLITAIFVRSGFNVR